jgi:mercury(II) reductase
MSHDCCSPTGAKTFDLAVIGAGSAGFSAAITAAEQGAQVALIGAGTIGGTCVNIGCVPSKTLIRAMESSHHVEAAKRFSGIRSGGGIEDWRAIVAQKDELVDTLRRVKYSELLRSYNNVAYREGKARMAGGGVEVDGDLIPAHRYIIATGARPSAPPIPGIEKVPYLTSTTALSLESLPKSLLVIGGGYIGCELAQMLARAGVRVTIVDLVPILSAAEPEISQALGAYFRDEGIAIRENVKPQRIRKTGQGVALDLTDNGIDLTLEAEAVLVATGRTPNTEDLNLELSGIAQLPNGGIKVDDRMRTTQRRVYAAGDVTGRDQFVYMAAYGAKIAAHNALNGDTWRYDNNAMPWVVFTDPQVASVGMTEAQAGSAGHDAQVSVLTLDNVPRALAARDTRGLIKLVADSQTKKLLGAHILAPEGADSIQTAALAIKQGLTVQALAEMIFPYLTTVEGLKLAAQAFERDVAKLSCCAG